MSSESIVLILAAVIGFGVGIAGAAALRSDWRSDDHWWIRFHSALGALFAAVGGTTMGVVSLILAIARW